MASVEAVDDSKRARSARGGEGIEGSVGVTLSTPIMRRRKPLFLALSVLGGGAATVEVDGDEPCEGATEAELETGPDMARLLAAAIESAVDSRVRSLLVPP